VLPSVEAAHRYAAHLDFPTRDRVDAVAQRRHSRRNHLAYLQQHSPLHDVPEESSLLGGAGDDASPRLRTANPPLESTAPVEQHYPPEAPPKDDDGGGRISDDVDNANVEPWRDPDHIQHHLLRTGLEVLVYVEAIETYTSSTMQARHSYHFAAGDIEFDKTFVPCVHVGFDGRAEIDLDDFHSLRPAPRNAVAMLSSPSIV